MRHPLLGAFILAMAAMPAAAESQRDGVASPSLHSQHQPPKIAYWYDGFGRAYAYSARNNGRQGVYPPVVAGVYRPPPPPRGRFSVWHGYNSDDGLANGY